MASDSVEIYYERQEQGSSLCGQHAINNLLQGPYFTAIDLGHIGAKLDEEESNLMEAIDEDEKLAIELSEKFQKELNGNCANMQRSRKYSNVSMEGLFSVEVILTALRQLNVEAIPLSHPQCHEANQHPDKEVG